MGTESSIDKNENDSSLSSHTVQLRKAFQDCSDGIERLRQACSDGRRLPFFDSNTSELIRSAWVAAERYQDERRDGINDVSRRLHTFNGSDSASIEVINVNDDDLLSLEATRDSDMFIHNCKEATQIKPRQFKQRYCARNVPCIIQGLSESDFSYVSSNWRSQNNHINVEWFRKYVGVNTKVPVRIDGRESNSRTNNDQSGNELDSDGRATECDTVEMTLCEWIQYCQQDKQRSLHDVSKEEERQPIELGSTGYLKDWHLLQLLSSEHISECVKTPLFNDSSALYSVPSIFERDLLNKFLTQYTRGDYKFVYWGPRESRTNLHSDVLHSFSWSYNVVGKKRWTFYVPDDNVEGNTKDAKSFELIQETGETIFVPSKWKHEVVNLVETLSINHNWITSSNIDLTYECLLTEISSIEKEIKEWGIVSDDDYETRENMLRGCVGLDVSMMVLMVLMELTELLVDIFSVRESAGPTQSVLYNDAMWESFYSIFRLRSVLEDMIFTNSARDYVKVVQRLAATLDSRAMASKITRLAEFCLELSAMLQKF